MKKVAQWLLIALGVTPLIVVYDSLSPTVWGKYVFLHGIAVVLALLIAFIFLNKKTSQEITQRWGALIKNRLFRVVTLGMGAMTLSTIFAFNQYRAFFGEVSRGEGYIVFLSIYIIYVGVSLLWNRAHWKSFFVVLSLATLGTFWRELWELSVGVYRPMAFIGNPIFLASFHLFSFLGGWYLVFGKGSKKDLSYWVGVLAIIASVIGIFLTKTRGTLAGAFVALIIILIVLIAKGKQQKIFSLNARRFGITLASIFVLFMFIFVSTRSASVWQKIPGLDRIAAGGTETVDSRFLYLRIAGHGFVQSTPTQQLFGWGWDNARFFADRYYDPAVYYYDPATIDRFHNKFADMLVMTGLVGVGSYLLLWIIVFISIARYIKKDLVLGVGTLAVFIAYFVQNLFAFDLAITLLMFYIFIAYLTQLSYDETK